MDNPARASAAIDSLGQLPTPALVIDLDRLEANVDRMQTTCERLGVALRPHLKTHKCVEIARLQVERGALGVTVSTLEEARSFAAAGFDDLTWAFPVILGRLREVFEVAAQVRRLRVVVDSREAIAGLASSKRVPDERLEVLIKVDCGYHRAGVDPSGGELFELARHVDEFESLRFVGLLSHSGQAYEGGGRGRLAVVAERERSVMSTAAERLRREGVEVEVVSVGSTPAMSAVESLEGVDEARPGNYVFYDWTQVVLGSATPADCALSVISSVVSSRPDGDWAICDAGALALSADPGPGAGSDSASRSATMGEIYQVGGYDRGELEDDLRLVSLSQEHGVLSRARGVGERLRILPNHSCLTAACFDRAWVSRGDEIVDRWTIHRQR